MPGRLSIGVVGAGIGGLAAAALLVRGGHRVTVYERAPRAADGGAGIWVAPNGMAVLQELELAIPVEEAGVPLDRVLVADGSLRPLLELDQAWVRAYFGFRIVSLRRADLQRLLLEAVDPGRVLWDRPVAGCRSGEAEALVHFAGGGRAAHDLVVAADGLRSTARRALFPGRCPRSAGQICWRAVVELDLPPPYEAAGVELWRGRHRFGFSPVGGSGVYFYAVAPSPAGEAGDFPRMRSTFASFPHPVPSLLAACSDEDLLRDELHDVPRLDRWVSGRIALLGDAAHACTPNLGQGASQALEDALVLARCLETSRELEEALERYQKLRIPRVRRVMHLSYEWGRLAHLGRAAVLRNFLVRRIPSSVRRRGLDWLFGGGPG